MQTVLKHIQYAKYLIKHKWFVFTACWKEGLYWRGIKHDWHKFLPSEWFPYADFFYGKKVRDSTGYYKPTDTGHKAFDFAWLLHQNRADHHWQWWICPQDDGGDRLFPMSHKSLTEMLCDWYGAGKAQLGEKHKGWQSVYEWYNKNKDKIRVHKETISQLNIEINDRTF